MACLPNTWSEGQGFYIDIDDNCPIKVSFPTKAVINAWQMKQRKEVSIGAF